MAVIGLESYFLFITFLNLYTIINIAEIELGEMSSLAELV